MPTKQRKTKERVVEKDNQEVEKCSKCVEPSVGHLMGVYLCEEHHPGLTPTSEEILQFLSNNQDK